MKIHISICVVAALLFGPFRSAAAQSTETGRLPASARGPGVQNCADLPGADAGEKIAACIAAVVRGGTADARDLVGAQTIAKSIVIDKPLTLLLPAATIRATACPVFAIAANGVRLHGTGITTQVRFAPSSFCPAIKISAGAIEVMNFSLRDFTLDSSGNSTRKIGIQLIDGAEGDIGGIVLQNWSDATHSSIGMQLQGRQTMFIHDIKNFSDQPFELSCTPNASIVCVDHFHFENIYAVADPSQPVWRAGNGTFLTNDTWDGYQAWVNGTYGFYWLDTTSAHYSYNLGFSNVRHEQSQNRNGYSFYIAPARQMFALNIYNVFSDAGHNGFYFRNVMSGTLRGSVYLGTSEAFNTERSSTLTVEDNFFNVASGATISASGMRGSWRGNDAASPSLANSIHEAESGRVPRIGGCGKGATIVGENSFGTITLGSGEVSGCTLAFTEPRSSPTCFVSTNSLTDAAVVSSVSSSELKFSVSKSFPGMRLYYQCRETR